MNISEVAIRQNITPATLRYYEQQGLIKPIKRNASGIRDYSNEDLNGLSLLNACAVRGCRLVR